MLPGISMSSHDEIVNKNANPDQNYTIPYVTTDDDTYILLDFQALHNEVPSLHPLLEPLDISVSNKLPGAELSYSKTDTFKDVSVNNVKQTVILSDLTIPRDSISNELTPLEQAIQNIVIPSTDDFDTKYPYFPEVRPLSHYHNVTYGIDNWFSNAIQTLQSASLYYHHPYTSVKSGCNLDKLNQANIRSQNHLKNISLPTEAIPYTTNEVLSLSEFLTDNAINGTITEKSILEHLLFEKSERETTCRNAQLLLPIFLSSNLTKEMELGPRMKAQLDYQYRLFKKTVANTQRATKLLTLIINSLHSSPQPQRPGFSSSCTSSEDLLKAIKYPVFYDNFTYIPPPTFDEFLTHFYMLLDVIYNLYDQSLLRHIPRNFNYPRKGEPQYHWISLSSLLKNTALRNIRKNIEFKYPVSVRTMDHYQQYFSVIESLNYFYEKQVFNESVIANQKFKLFSKPREKIRLVKTTRGLIFPLSDNLIDILTNPEINNALITLYNMTNKGPHLSIHATVPLTSSHSGPSSINLTSNIHTPIPNSFLNSNTIADPTFNPISKHSSFANHNISNPKIVSPHISKLLSETKTKGRFSGKTNVTHTSPVIVKPSSKSPFKKKLLQTATNTLTRIIK